jgi:diguanylate cyclase (GGDEF)-like protein
MSITLSILVVIVMVMFVGLALTLRKLHQQIYSLQKLVTKDALTSLQNWRSFDNTIKLQFARMKRTGSQLSLLVMNLDQFKEFNDTYGHTQGDEALIRIAAVLRHTMKR